jgi:hypothetical protein
MTLKWVITKVETMALKLVITKGRNNGKWVITKARNNDIKMGDHVRSKQLH